MPNFQVITTDILVIGGGGAAAMAALAANSLGVKVVTVSKENSLVGGATIESGGGINVINDPKDNPDIFYADILKGGAYINNPKLVRIFAERSRQALLNLEKYGFLLDRVGTSLRKVIRVEGASFPRSYTDRRENMGWCRGLSTALTRSGVNIFREVMIEKLLVKQGRVVGALGFSLVTGAYIVFNSKAVLLATGGLGQLYKMTTNSRTLTGDGFAMAWDAGAQLINMEMVQFIPFSFAYPKAKKGVNLGMCSIYGPNVKLFNGLGERYMYNYDPERLEYTTRDVAARANFTEILEGRGTERGSIIVDTTGNDPAQLEYYASAHHHQYMRLRDVFGDAAAKWKKPFEAAPAQHFTMGGVMIDEECKTSIPGLYAAGEVSGGLHGANRLAGNGLAEAIGFGDLSGRTIAQQIRNEKHITVDKKEINDEINNLEKMFNANPKGGIRPFQIKEKIKDIMWNCLGPIREKSAMEKAIADLIDIQKHDLTNMSLGYRQLKFNRERLEAAEVRLMVKTALLVANSALNREESRGSHYRKDFPRLNDNEWLKCSMTEKSKNGSVAISFKAVQG